MKDIIGFVCEWRLFGVDFHHQLAATGQFFGQMTDVGDIARQFGQLALAQLGGFHLVDILFEVSLDGVGIGAQPGAGDLAQGDLQRFDAIVTGVRAWNVREDLRAAHGRLREYMEKGGTVVVQYNTLDGPPGGGDTGALKNIGPFPMRIGRDRTTVEEAPVTFLLPDHRLLQSPNRIAAADFDGWVQERALYFPAEWDGRYEAVLESHDPGEPARKGGLKVADVDELYRKLHEEAKVL